MGGKFGEMSTFMNYTFQSFNFRGRQSARPFYDLIANIAAEEFGHIELVAAAINTMLADPEKVDDGKAPEAALADLKGIGNPQHFIGGGRGALPQDSMGNPWNGDYVFASRGSRGGPAAQLLPGAQRAQQQAEGLRDGRAPLRARTHRLPARPRRRAPGRLREGGRASDRHGSLEAVPDAADPDGQDPGVQAAHQEGPARDALPVLGRRLRGTQRDLERQAPGDRRRARRRGRAARGRAAERPAASAGRVRRRLRTRRAGEARQEAAQGRRAAQTQPTGAVADA